MDKILFGLLPYVGIPLLFGIAGFAFDFLCDDAFKAEIAFRVRDRRTAGTTQETLSAFNTSLVDRLFGTRFLSVRFLTRSALLSLSVLVLVIAVQAYLYGSDFKQILALQTVVGVEFAALLVVFALIIDYLCNVCAVIILQMAASRGRLIDLFVSFIANITLSMTIFTQIFPIGIVICLAYSVISSGSFIAKIQQIPQQLLPVVNITNVSIKNDALKAKFVSTPLLISSQRSEQPNPYNTEIMFIITQNNASSEKKFEYISEMIGTGNRILSLPQEAILRVKLPTEDLFSFRYLLSLYTGAFGATETVRGSFYNMMTFSPLAIKMTSIYTLGRTSNGIDSQGLVMCPNRTILTTSGIGNNLDELVKIGQNFCGMPIEAALIFAKGGRISDELAALAAGDSLLPLAAFFVSSLSITLLYYFGVILVAFGLFTNSSITRIFKIKALDIKRHPFTLLGIYCFILIEPLWLIVHHLIF